MKKRMSFHLAMMLTASMALAVASGCSSFERDWETLASEASPQYEDFTGRWVGSWRSHHNDHSGELRAIVEAQDEDTYRIRYRATYADYLTYSYEIEVEPELRDGVQHFAGEASLGIWGTYSHTGRASATDFYADYASSGDDFGVYHMRRTEEALAGE